MVIIVMSFVVHVLFVVLRLAVVDWCSKVILVALDMMDGRQVTLYERLEMKVTVHHVAMEWFMVKLVVLTGSVIAVDHRGLIVVPIYFAKVMKIVIPDLLLVSMALIHVVVWMSELVSMPLFHVVWV